MCIVEGNYLIIIINCIKVMSFNRAMCPAKGVFQTYPYMCLYLAFTDFWWCRCGFWYVIFSMLVCYVVRRSRQHIAIYMQKNAHMLKVYNINWSNFQRHRNHFVKKFFVFNCKCFRADDAFVFSMWVRMCGLTSYCYSFYIVSTKSL